MSGIHIVGVHGIRQWDTNTHKLGSDWRSALADGIVEHLGPATPMPDLTVPYYGDVFPRTRRFQLGVHDADVLEGLDDPEEEEFVIDALRAYAQPIGASEETVPTLGVPPRLHPVITALMAGIDRVIGHRTATLAVGRIREVYGYFHNPVAAEQARRRVADAIATSGARLLIAHSLGTVIVYDMFQREQIPLDGNHPVQALISCGSPLSWMALQKRLHVDTKYQLPDAVTWTNIFDPKDPITAGKGLSGNAVAVRDVKVHNDGNVHAVGEYLRQEAMAQAVAAIAS